MRRIFSLLSMAAVVVTVLALAAPAEAQFARAGLEGTVNDPDGAPLPGVSVTVENQDSGFTRTVVTGRSGSYNIAGLTPGTYRVTFSLQGFQTTERPNVRLRVGTTSTLNITMQLGSVEETVTVTAETPVVETTSKEVGGQVDSEQFDNLPSQNRSFVMFARLLPGVNASPDTESTASDSLFVNGQDDNNNSFTVDGAANNDDAIGARAGAQTRTALDAIQELQILTTQFDAEFGRTQGGVINAVTKSGSNDFHGSGFWYYQDSSLNEKNFFTEREGLEQPDADFQSVGFTVGGPIVQDTAHFFVSFERNTPNEGIARSFSSRPSLNFSTAEENLIRNWLVKGDWQATPNNKVSVRWLREYSPQFNQIIGGDATLESRREEDDKDMNIIGSVDSVFSDRSFNNFRLSFTREDVSFANPCFNEGGQDFATQRACPPLLDHPSFDLGTNNTAVNRINNSFQIDDTFSMFVPDLHGDHDMRWGVNYSHRTIKRNNASEANGDFNFPTDAEFDPNDVTTYPESFTIRIFGPSSSEDVLDGNNTLGLFYQDDWQPSSNLTLNLGVRYDMEDIVDDQNNIAPRLGFSWDPIGDGRTVVRGGYGRFYERLQFGFFSGFVTDGPLVTSGLFTSLPEAGASQQFFFDFAQANGITDLTALRDALAALLESGDPDAILNTFPTVDNASRKTPYADTFTLGVERELWEGISAGVDLVRTQNREILMAVDVNPAGGVQPDGSGFFRPDISVIDGAVEPRFAGISTFINGGESDYTALQFQGKKRMGQTPVGPLSGTVAYTWADQSGNAEPAGIDGPYFQAQTQTGYDFDANVNTVNGVQVGQIIGEFPDLGLGFSGSQGIPASWHRTHIFSSSWTWIVPGTSWQENQGLVFTGIWEWRSGQRDEVVLNTFLPNGNRALAPAGTFDCNVQSDICQGPKEFEGIENTLEMDEFNRFDLSFRYRIPVRQANITVLADIFNAFNEVNFGTSSASERPDLSAFLIPTSALSPREFQIGARVDF